MAGPALFHTKFDLVLSILIMLLVTTLSHRLAIILGEIFYLVHVHVQSPSLHQAVCLSHTILQPS
jgi:hypothetical protein